MSRVPCRVHRQVEEGEHAGIGVADCGDRVDHVHRGGEAPRVVVVADVRRQLQVELDARVAVDEDPVTGTPGPVGRVAVAQAA